MTATISIDIGGTFTDAYVTLDGAATIGKAPTTRHNIGQGLRAAIGDAANHLDVGVIDLLSRARIIRYATTIALNTVLEGTGPWIGLITTAGFEETIYIGRARQWVDGKKLDEVRSKARVDKPIPLVPHDLVVGVAERVDVRGNILQPLDVDEVRAAVHTLVERGAEAFVVGLQFSFVNPRHEQLVREIIDEEYPEMYLGAAPVILSCELSPTLGEYPRIDTAILAAYMQRELADELSGLGDDLRDATYSGSLLVVHSGGGAASVARTSSASVYNSGPVAGLFGGAEMSQLYDLKTVALTDMGGTSFDLGVLRDGRPRYYEMRPVIEQWLVRLPTLQVQSIGAGGGSVVSVEEHSRRILVGPRSMGSNPGPACYDLGGEEATVTDADVALGLINPEHFLGGRMPLDRELAVAALERVGKQVGLGALEMAHAVRRIVDARMGNEIYKELALKGIKPADTAIFAYGGAGPTHCCGYAESCSPPAVFIFPHSPVFCAFGAGAMDVTQTYVRALQTVLVDPTGAVIEDAPAKLNAVVEQLRESAVRDFTGDGFGLDEITVNVAAEMKYGGQIFSVLTESPTTRFDEAEAVRQLARAFEDRYAALYSKMSAFPAGGIEVTAVQIEARVATSHPIVTREAIAGSNPDSAVVEERAVSWDGRDFSTTRVYRYHALRAGNVVPGPAVVEAEDTTVVVPDGWSLWLDSYRTGILVRNGNERYAREIVNRQREA